MVFIRCCDSGAEETQEHLKKCEGAANERRGLEDWEKWQTHVTFWKRMTKRIGEREVEEKKKKKEENDRLKRNRARLRRDRLLQTTTRRELQANGRK